MPRHKPHPPRTSDAAPVDAPAGALDDDAGDEPLPPEAQAILEALEGEERFERKRGKISEASRATSASFRYAHLIEEHYAHDPGFFIWDENRSLDRQNFDYLFYHRAHFTAPVQTWLEIIASKITHVTLDGEDGYFRKAMRNVNWTAHITPMLFGPFRDLDSIVRCGLWSSASNSRRCHKPDLCPLCLWNDHLKVLVHAFGERSGAFARAQAWWLLTLGFTSNPNNSKFVVKDFDPHMPLAGDGDRGYDPFPVELAQQDPLIGYNDARFLGLIVQEALDELYQSGVVDGCRNKLEGAFRLQPGADTRMNMHGHAIANGSETNGGFIAQELYEAMRRGLKKYRRQMWHDYCPDVQVCPIRSAEELEQCIVYTEKVVAVGDIVADAMARPEARNENGTWNQRYVVRLENSLAQLLGEDIPCIFTKFRYDQELLYLRRRKAVGNMTFTDSGTCIGSEPGWHKKVRRTRAKEQKKQREKRRKEQAKAEAQGVLVVGQKRQKRRRKLPRRLKRSLGRTQRRLNGQRREVASAPRPGPGTNLEERDQDQNQAKALEKTRSVATARSGFSALSAPAKPQATRPPRRQFGQVGAMRGHRDRVGVPCRPRQIADAIFTDQTVEKLMRQWEPDWLGRSVEELAERAGAGNGPGANQEKPGQDGPQAGGHGAETLCL
jgi:hypothetical protein